MITTTLKTSLETAGCTLILYESSQLANLLTDQSKHDDVIGLILEPNSITFDMKGNGLQKHYQPITIEIMKQTRLEDTAENNKVISDELIVIVELFIKQLVLTQEFKKITTFTASKILENRYDANLIGWSLPLDLKLIENTPCE